MTISRLPPPPPHKTPGMDVNMGTNLGPLFIDDYEDGDVGSLLNGVPSSFIPTYSTFASGNVMEVAMITNVNEEMAQAQANAKVAIYVCVAGPSFFTWLTRFHPFLPSLSWRT